MRVWMQARRAGTLLPFVSVDYWCRRVGPAGLGLARDREGRSSCCEVDIDHLAIDGFSILRLLEEVLRRESIYTTVARLITVLSMSRHMGPV